MRPILFTFLVIIQTDLVGQDYTLFQKTLQPLQDFASAADTAGLKNKINDYWSALRKAKQIPLIEEDSVAFFYRGEAKSVTWMGDFNGWGYLKDFANKGKKIRNTDIWLLKAAFPKDARLDYKILINESGWVLDSENSRQQWSGVGGGSPNSELRMPLWKEDPILTERPGIAHGLIKKDILFPSKLLGYQIMYSAYLPVGYEHLGKLPVVYVTDGYEYILPELGNMITVLDNLIADKKIQPIVAIFIDHREPINRAKNRRMEELNMNEKYLRFFTDEFIPTIEEKYPIQRDAAQRAVLGSSMGGLTSAYFAFSRPDLFSMAGIQSPAFWVRPQIYALCNNPNSPKVRVSLTSGLVNDASEGSRKMKDILQNNACVYYYRENNEGHSWGNWRSLIDDILIDFFGIR